MTNLDFFFYGTLMSSAGRDKWLAHLAKPVAPATLNGFEMYSVSSSFPAIVPGEGLVRGEYWRAHSEECLPELLRVLDQIEGYQEARPEWSMYVRREVLITDCTAGQPVTAQTYVWNRGIEPHMARIECNDWRAWRNIDWTPEEVA